MATSPTTSLKLEPELKARLQRLAGARRRTTHWLMREAIVQYVEREEQREQLHQDALAAWAEYAATGEHLTAAEADRWLAQLEAGEATEPPACHD
jgi:predicted transcriptional regulator